MKFDIAYGIAILCLALYVGLPFISLINSDFLEERSIPSGMRVHTACVVKDTCNMYSAVRSECAIAFNIEKCIDTRLVGKMYSMCLPDGRNIWSEDLMEPNFLTCKFNDGIMWIKSLQR